MRRKNETSKCASKHEWILRDGAIGMLAVCITAFAVLLDTDRYGRQVCHGRLLSEFIHTGIIRDVVKLPVVKLPVTSRIQGAYTGITS